MRTAARTGLVAVATALVGAVAAAPAGAHTEAPADIRATASSGARTTASVGARVVASAAAPASWTAAPAAGRPYVYLEGPAGSVLQDTLSLTNPGARPLTVRLSGQGAPVSFAARTVTVPARTRADVPFAVTVTADTPPGEHRGTVRASAAGREVRVDLRLRVSG
ncbi:COG1470 family protein, partial [Streptomyces massasporeus]